MEEDMYNEMDGDQSGTIDFHELKVFLTRKYDNMFKNVASLAKWIDEFPSFLTNIA